MNSTTGRRCVIVGGAPIGNYVGICEYLHEDDYFIFCDCGLKHLDDLHIGHDPLSRITPDLIVGDFDSHENPVDSGDVFSDGAKIETIVLPCEKDETDTAFAASEAIRRGFKDFLIIGAVGARMDHTLVNISLLLKLYNAGCSAILVDDYSEMEIIGKEPSYIEDSFKYFSLVSLFGPSRGITITGAKYEVADAEIRQDEQYATSNEVLPGQHACVTVGDGLLLLIKIRQE